LCYMKLVSYLLNHKEHLGIFHEDKVYNLAESAKKLNKPALPDDMLSFLNQGESAMKTAKEINENIEQLYELRTSDYELLAPVPHPTSCRDGYAFRQHVEAARRNRKVPMIAEFDQYPIF